MATMVARGSSPLASPISIEKGSRNKRKFRAENTDPTMVNSSPPSDNFDLFPVENSSHAKACDVCHTFCQTVLKQELPVEQVRLRTVNTGWTEQSEAQLEETVLINLDSIFKTAIKMIVGYGYSEVVATNAVLRSGICYGCNDIVSNVVDNAVAVLKSGQEVDGEEREDVEGELKKLERRVLGELVSVFRDVKPHYSVGEAMWCLLICDMNVSVACGTETLDCGVPLRSGVSEGAASEEAVTKVEQESVLSAVTNTMPEMPAVVGIPNLPSGRFSASGNMGSLERLAEESVSSTSVSHRLVPEIRTAGGKKVHLSGSKRDMVLRQKTIHVEKSYRAYGSKAALRAAKQGGLGSLLLDKKCKPVSDLNGISMKSAMMKLNKAVGSDTPQADPTLKLSFSEGSGKPTYSIQPPLPFPNTELSLSLPSTSSSNGGVGIETGFVSDNISGHLVPVPKDQKPDMFSELLPGAKDLHQEMQDWSNWAQQKVMQAASRLNKEKPELQNLRQEKEEVARLKKEKQSLEENTRKKLSEMEIALSKASGQIERANAAARRLEVENSELRKEMEVAKLRAAESAASCQEVSKRELKTLKKFQSWEKQKMLFQEELTSEKRKLSQLQQQLMQAKEYRDHLEAMWKQEEKAKAEALVLGNSERKTREQIEVSGRSKENALKLKADTDLKKYKDDIKRLEHQIAQLRLRTDSSKIAALKWGPDGSYASHLSDGRKENDPHFVSKLFDFQEVGGEEIQRERECVMCLTEEMSVVFLPCAHQVVCAKCNELHEKQGMKDCPSCRTPIQRRICVLSFDS